VAAVSLKTFASVETWPAFRTEMQAANDRRGISIIEVRTARDRNVELHRETWAAVGTAVRAELSRRTAGQASE